MKRDRRLFATSALGLLLVLPHPALSFASGPRTADSGLRAATGAMLLAQNDQSPDQNRKKRHGRGGEQKGGGQEAPAAPGHEAQQGGHGQEGGQGQGRRHGRPGGEQHQAEQPNAPAAAPNAAQGGEQGHGRHHAEQPGATGSQGSQAEEGHRKQHQDHAAPQPQQSEAQQPSRQGEETPHERRKHGKNGGSNGQTQAQKPESGSASQQSTTQQKQAPSAAQAQPSTSQPSRQEERRRHGHEHGAARGEARPTQDHQTAPNTGQPAQNGVAPARQQQNQPAENSKQGAQSGQQQTQGKNGGPQLPEQNGTQQPRPNFHEKGHGQNGQEQNGQAHGGRPQNAAPVFDSQKRPFGHGNGDHRGQAGNQPSPNGSSQGAAQFGPTPKSDQAAQSEVKHGKIESIDAMKGKRVRRDQLPPFQRPKGADVVKETDNRVILRLGDQMVVRNHDQRIAHGARDVYYEDLPHDRRRETVLRPDGSKVVTIRNEYGDVIRRSRILPDGREMVLVYVDDRDLERDRDDGWRDPGADLPPMRLTVPEDDYILDASEIHDPDRYYEFLDQPPVERVPRLYTIGEVKRSARIRDMVPRIDLDTINFDFGSAKIGDTEVSKLQAVAEAMQRILKKNPAETFLIEGHTDAVGSDQSNLLLSDERAEAVAAALTNSFDIPPENLTTQGYGEEFLKVDTDGPNRQNRRVTIRRITPLIAPVASNR